MNKLLSIRGIVWLAIGWGLLALPTIIHISRILASDCLFYDSYLTCEPETVLNNVWNALFLALAFGCMWLGYSKLMFQSFVNFSWSQDKIWILFILFFALMTVPIGTFDLFYYFGAAHDEIMREINPYINSFIRYNPFAMQFNYGEVGPVMYSPLWLSLSKLIVTFSDNQQITAMYAYKVVMLLFLLGSSVFLKRTATLFNISSHFVFWAFLLNPLMLFESATNGHNEMMLAFFVSAAIYFAAVHKFSTTFLLLTLGFLTKVTAALMIPFFALYAIFHNTINIPRRVGAVALLGVVCGGLVVVAFADYWVGLETLTSLRWQSRWINNTVFSFWHAIGALYFESTGQPEVVSHGLPRILQIILGLVFLSQIFRIGYFLFRSWQQKRALQVQDILKMTLVFLLAYFVFFSRSYLPWYVTPLFAFVLLIHDWWEWAPAKSVLVLTMSSMAYYIIQAGFGYAHMANYWVQAAAAVTIFGPVLLVLIQSGYLRNLKSL